MTNRLRRTQLFSGIIAAIYCCPGTAPASVFFNFSTSSGMDQQAIDGFNEAGSMWSYYLGDTMTVNINIDFTQLDAGVLGSTSSSRGTIDYSSYKTSLDSDRSSTYDDSAVANLQPGSSFAALINRTANSPNGEGSATPYLDNDGDANNSTIRLTTANAKALGLLTPDNTASDASISFNSDFTWDFDRSDGILSSAIDFVGVATHEIGHALGFISGVDILDGNSTETFFSDDAFSYVAPLDLYRYSDESFANGAIDWTAGTADKYFSIDGGTNSLAVLLSTGATWGDGSQASHWKDNQGLGIMDPTASNGELLQISDLDLLGFDVIGYNIIPEPSSLALIALCGGLGLWIRRSFLI
ncbi:NF038122 family metalloprotease [Pontiella sulfatireligans]|uniref:Uncharacterized protein n=1 Tax=Pontiella sulfatireligans TaxID=2750658 RepID=A0A6C2UHT0_9BACT|nr:NF038122 family metalloprotease [Pontiella sulfatireligans]VGO19688.1 hypothetical protein SCARR_01747 [Pontiella sulfatireligans]